MGKIKLNEKAPDFTLIDTEGKEFRLSEWKSKKWVYLVLNRGFA
ncbi:MAG: redoxin domain-containing protein [Clostridia bacterium]|nr:redoxin domain-containing protein [Clostridia bacterium]